MDYDIMHYHCLNPLLQWKEEGVVEGVEDDDFIDEDNE